MIIQLEAENACKNKNLDNATADTGNARIKEGKARDVDNKTEQRLVNLKNENGRLQNELEKAIAEAHAASTRTQQFEDENDKMKKKISLLESEIDRLKEELNKVIKDIKKGVSGISAEHADDVKLRQRLAQLNRESAKMRAELDAALKDRSGGCDQAAHIRSLYTKLKNIITQLGDEHSRLRKKLENSFSDAKELQDGIQSLAVLTEVIDSTIADASFEEANRRKNKLLFGAPEQNSNNQWLKGQPKIKIQNDETTVKELFSKLAPPYAPPPLLNCSEDSEQHFLLKPINTQEMVANIQVSKATAPGIDEIHYSMLANLPQIALDFLCNIIYNRILLFGESCDALKNALVAPIPKPNGLSSLRPIPLMP
nr:unnamed protein product [Callosobruchus chinensis]